MCWGEAFYDYPANNRFKLRKMSIVQLCNGQVWKESVRIFFLLDFKSIQITFHGFKIDDWAKSVFEGSPIQSPLRWIGWFWAKRKINKLNKQCSFSRERCGKILEKPSNIILPQFLNEFSKVNCKKKSDYLKFVKFPRVPLGNVLKIWA